MRVTIAEVVAAFDLLYENIHDRGIRKTLELNSWSERDLLPLGIHDYNAGDRAITEESPPRRAWLKLA